jgi:hypothetical protein
MIPNKLFVKSGCRFCRITVSPVAMHNLKVGLKNKIDILDCYEYEHFKMRTHPLLDRMPVNAYPTLILKGIKITNIMTKDNLRALMDGMTEEDKIVPESNKWSNM